VGNIQSATRILVLFSKSSNWLVEPMCIVFDMSSILLGSNFIQRSHPRDRIVGPNYCLLYLTLYRQQLSGVIVAKRSDARAGFALDRYNWEM